MSESKQRNILVVDDDQIVLDVMDKLLRSGPAHLILTASPEEAIEILRTTEIAVLLCDMAMPEINGNVVLAEARRTQPDIVSILVSGRADQAATVKAINEGGIWKFIPKPWHAEEMLQVVRDAVAHYDMLCVQRRKLRNLAKRMTKRLARHATEAGGPRRGAPRTKRIPRAKVVVHRRHAARRKQPRKKLGAFLSQRYKLLELIDEGGMGTIYKATDTLLAIPVAVKVLSPDYTLSRHNVQALKKEARIAMQLSHRHIVRLHNLQITQGTYFLVMEYVSGYTFRHIILENGRLPLKTVVQVADICGDALDYAHRHGVLHRDLKPENLMLTEDGVLKIIDFGLACLMGKEDDSNIIAGTPIYMSPEQIRGATLDQKTDIYSMGAVLYELLSGTSPFPPNAEAEDILGMCPPKLPGVPEPIAVVLKRALAVDPNDRWPTTGALARALMQAAP